MKRLLTLLLLFSGFYSFSQITWSSPVAVANSSYSNLHPRVALDKNGNPLVTWGNSGANKAYFARWNGTSFTAPVALNPGTIPVFAASWAGPDITSHGDTVYAVYKHTPEDTNHIYITKSVDGGQNFSTPVRVDSYVMDSNTRFPTVTTDAVGNPIVAFMKFDNMFMSAKWVVARSTDMGSTFSPDVKASGFTGGDVCDCCPGSILCSGNNVLVSYRNNLSNIRTMWTGFSTDGGVSFPNGIESDTTNWMLMSCPSSGPDALLVGDSIYTVFMSGASGSSRVYINRSSLSQQQAASCNPMTGNFAGLSAQNYPRIAGAGNAATMVWKENANSTTRICLKFTDTVTQGFDPAYDTIASGSVENADVTMSVGAVHVVWEDDNSGKVMYRKGTYPLPSAVSNIAANSKPVSIFPNPAHDYFVCDETLARVYNCSLVDQSGKRTDIIPAYQNGKLRVTFHDLPPGTYTVILQGENEQTYSAKLLIK